MNPYQLVVTTPIVEETLRAFRKAGDADSECIVLWLGRWSENGNLRVVEAWVPEQEADFDYFHIPPHAMAALLSHLGDTRTLIAAQVHTHPREAFHSYADDTRAIVRHRDALSLVIPYFAQETDVGNFKQTMAAFRLSANNAWLELAPQDREHSIQII